MHETNNTQTDLVNSVALTLAHGSLEMVGSGLHYGDLTPGVSLRTGSDMTVASPSPSSLGTPFTLELWAQVNGGAVAVGLSTRTPNDFGSQIGFDTNGALSCTIGNGASFLAIIAPTSPNCGVFSRYHHVALVVSSSQVIAYLDGTAIQTSAIAAGAVAYDANHVIRIGSYNGSTNWINSVVSRVAIYNKLLAAADVLNHFENGIPGGGVNPGTIVTLSSADLSAILNAVQKTFPAT